MFSSVCMNHGVNAVPVDMNHGEVCCTIDDAQPIADNNTL
jgi:hypothetical protein